MAIRDAKEERFIQKHTPKCVVRRDIHIALMVSSQARLSQGLKGFITSLIHDVKYAVTLQ